MVFGFGLCLAFCGVLYSELNEKNYLKSALGFCVFVYMLL